VVARVLASVRAIILASLIKWERSSRTETYPNPTEVRITRVAIYRKSRVDIFIVFSVEY
jgi:hypothetical protein